MKRKILAMLCVIGALYFFLQETGKTVYRKIANEFELLANVVFGSKMALKIFNVPNFNDIRATMAIKMQ